MSGRRRAWLEMGGAVKKSLADKGFEVTDDVDRLIEILKSGGKQ